MTNNITNTRLETIASTINNTHQEVEAALQEGYKKAVLIGDLLLEAKKLIGFGNWLGWCSNNCAFSERTAQNYMRLAQHHPELAKSATIADLSYKQALHLLTEPKESTPTQAKPWYWLLEPHDLCLIFPMDDQAIQAIAHDMQTYGYDPTLPIVLFEGKVLDGKLRLEACKRSGVDPCITIFEGDVGAAKDFVIRKNGLRKNSTQDQKTIAALRLVEINNTNKAIDDLSKRLDEASDIKDLVMIYKQAGEYQRQAATNTLEAQREAGKCITELCRITGTNNFTQALRVANQYQTTISQERA